MGLSNIFRKNPLKKLDQRNLRETEVKLKIKSNQLQDEIKRIEAEIEGLFQKSKKGKSKVDDLTIARRIKTQTQKREMKVTAQAEVEKEITAVSNLLIIIEHEADLKATGDWDSLQQIPPEQLEKHLAEIQLSQEDRQSQVSMITEMTSVALNPSMDQEEGLEDILKAMDALKEGNMEPETARENVTKQEVEE